MPATLRSILPSPIGLLHADEVSHPERALARGEVHRVRRGIYAPAEGWNALAPWDRYLARVHATALAYPDAVFTHESAAVLRGLGVIGDPVTVHLLVESPSASRAVAGVRAHARSDPPSLVECAGILVTDDCETAVALARQRHNAVGRAVADAALRLDPALEPEALVRCNETRASSRGRRHARWALSGASAVPESLLESVNLALLEWLGFPAPELQRVFRHPDGSVDRGDFWWPSIGLLGEVDGEVKYDGTFGAPREALRARRQRDARLLGAHVRSIAHWGWAETARIDPVRALLTGHGLRQVAQESPVQLHALGRLLHATVPHPRDLNGAATPRGTPTVSPRR